MSLEFKDPPTAANLKHDHVGIAQALRERPGDWALVLRSVSTGNAQHIRAGSIKAYGPAGSYEARSVQVSKGKADIYARFVGAL